MPVETKIKEIEITPQELLSVSGVTVKTLVRGDEYLIAHMRCIGIYLGNWENDVFFAVTYAHKDQIKEQALTLYGYTAKEGAFNTHKRGNKIIRGNFIEIYDYWSSRIENFDDLTVITTAHPRYNNYDYIPLRTQVLAPTMAKPSVTSNVNKTLSSIKKDSPRTSSDYKIANLMLSKLPIDFCELNEIGLISAVAHNKTAYVLTLNRDKAIKAINKWARMTLKEINEVNRNFFSVVQSNFELTKVGRMVKKITGNLFPDTAIESFVSTFNVRLGDFSAYKIEVVSGDKIPYWYNVKQYTKEHHNSLQNSCMRYSNLANQINFYAHNPNCSMVIATLAGKLFARALVWTLHDGTKYQDRIYYSTEADRKLLIKWASDNNMVYSYHEANGNFTKSLLVEVPFDNIAKNEDIAFPYTDTFKHATRDCKYIVRTKDDDKDPDFVDWHERKMNTFRISSSEIVSQWFKRNFKGLIKEGNVFIYKIAQEYNKPADNIIFEASQASENDCVWATAHGAFILKSEAGPRKGHPKSFAVIVT